MGKIQSITSAEDSSRMGKSPWQFRYTSKQVDRVLIIEARECFKDREDSDSEIFRWQTEDYEMFSPTWFLLIVDEGIHEGTSSCTCIRDKYVIWNIQTIVCPYEMNKSLKEKITIMHLWETIQIMLYPDHLAI